MAEQSRTESFLSGYRSTCCFRDQLGLEESRVLRGLCDVVHRGTGAKDKEKGGRKQTGEKKKSIKTV